LLCSLAASAVAAGLCIAQRSRGQQRRQLNWRQGFLAIIAAGRDATIRGSLSFFGFEFQWGGLRTSDIAGRAGGGELPVVLPRASADDALMWWNG
jgi:hypothetical protein